MSATLDQFFEPSVLDTKTKECHEYEKGMFFTLNNRSSDKADLSVMARSVYRSLFRGIKGKPGAGKEKLLPEGSIAVEGRLPDKKIVMEVLNRKIPFMVYGIHPYNLLNHHSKVQNKGYCHVHGIVFGTHYHLPSEEDVLKDRIDYTTKMLLRHTKQSRYTKKENSRPVDIQPMGTGKYEYGHEPVELSSVYEYLHLPASDPHKHCCINYVAGMEHSPWSRTPLLYVFKKIA